MNPLTLRMIAFQVLVFLALAFGTLAWIAKPEGAFIWLTGMAAMPVTWVFLKLTGKIPSDDCPEERRTILNSLVGAALLIAGALAASALGSMGVMDESWIVRYAMISNALVLVIIGNALPKKIETGCAKTRAVQMQRLLGWTFVLSGFALVGIWLLPISEGLAMGISAPVFLTIASVSLFGVLRRGQPPSEVH
ncbi:MAG: hypothetical protein AAGJ52_01185 [Pseudomonadota bacterium]